MSFPSDADQYAAEVQQRKIASHLALRDQLLQFFQTITHGDILASHYLHLATLSVTMKPCLSVSLCHFEQFRSAHQQILKFFRHSDMETAVLELTDLHLTMPSSEFESMIHDFECGEQTRRVVVLASEYLPLHVDKAVSESNICVESYLPSSVPLRASAAAEGDELEICDDDDQDESVAHVPIPVAQSADQSREAQHDSNIQSNLSYLSSRFSVAMSEGSESAPVLPTFALFAFHRYNALPNCALSVPVKADAAVLKRLSDSINTATKNSVIFERLVFDASGHMDAAARFDSHACMQTEGGRVQEHLNNLMACLEADYQVVCAADCLFNTNNALAMSHAARIHSAFGLVRLAAASKAVVNIAASAGPWEFIKRLETDRLERWHVCRPLATNHNGVVFTPVRLAAMLDDRADMQLRGEASAAHDHESIQSMLQSLKHAASADCM
jgi:hypothetical protein